MKKKMLIVLAMLLFSLSGCGSNENIQQTDGTKAAVQEEVEPAPEPEPEPEPIVIPDPVVYTGTGDDVIEIDSLDYAYVFQIYGNDDGGYFSVTAYDENGEHLSLLVNTASPYVGITLDPTLSTKILEVKADGNWTVELLPAIILPEYTSGETVSGKGDTVFYVRDIGMTATIKGNESEDYFSIWSYGDSSHLVMSTAEKYDGKVMLKGNPFMFAVNAKSDWEITFN